jgi:hypothetical protein
MGSDVRHLQFEPVANRYLIPGTKFLNLDRLTWRERSAVVLALEAVQNPEPDRTSDLIAFRRMEYVHITVGHDLNHDHDPADLDSRRPFVLRGTRVRVGRAQRRSKRPRRLYRFAVPELADGPFWTSQSGHASNVGARRHVGGKLYAATVEPERILCEWEFVYPRHPTVHEQFVDTWGLEIEEVGSSRG